jgi:MoaA/NifB/PqqE/SkfB family radical SAM enzyme
MNVDLIRSRFNSLKNTRNMYPKLFTIGYILKNSLELNYYYYFKNGIAPEVMNIDLKVTKRCNANCYFCYAETVKGNANELTTKQILSFVNSFNKQKKAFFITGGEPFLRKDVFDIIKGIKNQGSFCGIVTNGTLITKDKLRQLIDTNIDNIVFSLHGLAESHNRVISSNLGFEKIISTISQLKKYKERKGKKTPYILINSVINRNTFKEFNELIRICNNAGADAVRFAHPSFIYVKEKNTHICLSKKIFGKEIRTCQYVSDDTFFSLNKKKIMQLEEGKKHLDSKIKIAFHPELSAKEIKEWYDLPFRTTRKCMYLYSSCFINERGDISPCQFYPFSFGNILEDNFDDIWNNARYRKFRQTICNSLLPACSRCIKLF